MTSIRIRNGLCPLLGLGLAIAPLAQAAQTDIATVPLITSSPQEVLPNIMFVLDDSGSMDFNYMPDQVKDFDGKYGFVSSQCNGVYYNPNITYSPPVDYTGASYPNATFTAAWDDGFNTSSGTKLDLSKDFKPTGNYTAQPAFYYTYSGTNSADARKTYYDTSSTFYKECNTSIGSSTLFTKVVVASSEQTNFANWYSYYRKRILMMKSASGLAFKGIGDQFRVGFMSINNNSSPSFLNIDTFKSAQKQAWYGKLYGAKANNSTPLREALSRAGQIYAGKLTSLYNTTVNDPVQYSCQKNFTLLSTDGFWNGSTDYDLSDNAVGNQDGTDPRPFNDGMTSTAVYQATVKVSGSSGSGSSVTSLKVGGIEILAAATSASKTVNTVATRIAAQINACTTAKTGNCGVKGYSAVASSGVVTITAPGSVSGSPVAVITSTMTLTTTAFASAALDQGGTSDTLADVAAYYYKTDLRSATLGNQIGAKGADVSANNVLPGADDDATWQHMTTFTLGIGTRGRMVFTPTYKTNDTAGDYTAVLNGTPADAANGICAWQSTKGSTCNWPTPGSDQIENIDDLWHAAVNGRGSFFSASDPAALSTGIQSALQAVNEILSDAAAATTSTPNVKKDDNFEFSSTFRSGEWSGELGRFTLDLKTGDPAGPADWLARAQLDAKTSRTIYTYDGSSPSHLRTFIWGNLTTAEQAYFSTPYISSVASTPLWQFCASGTTCLNSAAQTAASGKPVVDFIRGDRSNEGAANDTSKYFRARASVLGDIVSSEAVYVKDSRFHYTDAGYNTFKSSNVNRRGMVYVGANDGMLHAFDSSDGDEVWAYIPQMLLPSLYKLADKFYPNRHTYYVDGTPVQGDAYFGGAWHTILVGGLNAGGRGYYALDITDPNNPKALWEFTDTNMGFTFGNPKIGKLKDGTWVAFVTSGYNNVSPGDGQGRLYVLNAGTGALIRSIATGQGDTTTPSGLGKIATWANNGDYDNTVQRVYGGDLLGNLWRFDVNGDVGATGYDAQVIATLKDASGTAQPITTKPELGLVAGNPVVFVGTGRYLGASDLSDTSPQTFYAIKDKMGATSYGSPRADSTFVKQTLTDSVCPAGEVSCSPGEGVRVSSNSTVNFAVNNGWYIDLPVSSERANTDPKLAFGTLSFVTNVLNPSACTVGGSSFKNYVDYRTGGSLTSSGIVSVSMGQSLAMRVELIKLPDGTLHGLVRKTDNTIDNRRVAINPSRTTRRIGWRELVND